MAVAALSRQVLALAAIHEGMMGTVPSDPSASRGRETALVDLALQGGGSHGAFTWGVLDRLLEESWLRIDGISGTSAGAMNAVVLVDGYEKDGPEGARAALGAFWRRVSHSARFSSSVNESSCCRSQQSFASRAAPVVR